MEEDEEVFLDIGWKDLEERFNKKTLKDIKKYLSDIDNETKDKLILELVELVVNLQKTIKKNNYLLEPLLSGQVECR